MIGKEITVHWKKVYPKMKVTVESETESTVTVLYHGLKLEIDKKHIV